MTTQNIAHKRPIRLSLADLRRLLSVNDLTLGVTSPFGYIRNLKTLPQGESSLSPGADAALSWTEISHEPETNAALAQSLKIISSPRARLRLMSIKPSAPPIWLNFFTDGEAFVLAYVHRDWFYVTMPILKEEISQLLLKQFIVEAGERHSSETYLSAHLRLISVIWGVSKSGPDNPISVEQALSALNKAGMSTEQASAALRSATAAGCIAARKQKFSEVLVYWRYQLRSRWSGISSKAKRKLDKPAPARGTMLEVSNYLRYWLRSFWSGSFLVIERRIFAAGENGPLSRRSERIAFAGAQGLRIMCQGLRGSDWLSGHGLACKPSLSSLEDCSMVSFEQINRHSAAQMLDTYLSVTA